MTAVRYQLPNGLRVVLQENHAAKVVAFQAWVAVGSADEPPELAGIAHVFEHMLFKGTARRGVGQIAHEVEAAGGEINAWTSFDQTVYHLVLASRFFDTGLDILADALQNSSFDPVELERELKVVLEEVKQGEDNPSRVATQALFGAAYARHPYRRPVIGYTKTVKSFTRERLLDFFHRWYVANNVTLVVVGDFEVKRAQAAIAEAWGKMASRPLLRAREARKEPAQKAARARVVTQDVRETQVGVAFHIPGIHHDDTAALDLLAIILGQGDSSRLTLGLKRRDQLVTDAFAYAYTPRDPGLLVAGATMPPGDLSAALAGLMSETFRLRHEEVSDTELSKARAIIESDAIYQKETVQGQARKLGFFETVGGGIDWEDEYNRQVRAVTPATLMAAAQKYLTVENATIAALVPEVKTTDGKKLEAELIAAVDKASKAAEARYAPTAMAPPARDEEVLRVKLPSGARLLVKRDASVGLVAMRAVWMGGLRYEDARTNGVNNLIAALVTRGTRTLTGDELAHEVEAMAGSIGGFSGRNSFGLRAEMLARHWERGLELVADCILQPAFSDDELEKERRQALEEIRTQADNISSEAFRLFQQTLYQKHPYRLDVIGTADSVASLTRKRLTDYYKRHMSPSQMTLAIVGDVDPRAVLAKARALFGAAPGKLAPPPASPALPWDAAHPVVGQDVFKFQNKQQAHVVYGFPGTTITDDDRFALEVLATILSGQGGRLFVELRDKRGLAYRVSAFSVEGVDPGYFAVYIATSPENLAVAKRGIEDELAKIAAVPVPKQELERAKRYLVGAHEISLQRRAALASTLAFHEAYGVGWDEYRRYAPGILAVSAADVQRVARKYLARERAIVATVKPEDAAPVVAKGKAARAGAKAARAGNGRTRRQ